MADETLYYSESQGRYLDPSEVTDAMKSQGEPMAPRPQPGFLDMLDYGASKGALGATEGLASVGGLLENQFGFDMGAKGLRHRAQEASKALDQNIPIEPGSFPYYATHALAGATEMAPALMTGPLGMISYFGATAGANRDLSLEDQGVDPQTAARSGLASTAINVGTSALPFAATTPGGGLLSNMARGAFAGAGGNVVAGGAETLNDYETTGRTPSLAEYYRQLKEQLATGAIQGTAIGAHESFRTPAQRAPVDQAAVDAMSGGQDPLQLDYQPVIAPPPPPDRSGPFDGPGGGYPFKEGGDRSGIIRDRTLDFTGSTPLGLPEPAPQRQIGYDPNAVIYGDHVPAPYDLPPHVEDKGSLAQATQIDGSPQPQGDGFALVKGGDQQPSQGIERPAGFGGPRTNEEDAFFRRILADAEAGNGGTRNPNAEVLRPPPPPEHPGLIVPEPSAGGGPRTPEEHAALQGHDAPTAATPEVHPQDTAPLEAPAVERSSPIPHEIPDATVHSVPASEIVTRPELMQFKRSDNLETGTNAADRIPQDANFDHIKAGNLLLWEPENPAAHGLKPGQRLIVANGHHRFEFGESKSVDRYNAHILREADGYTAEHARAIGAENNIADGKGTAHDRAVFTRIQAGTLGADAALARAKQVGIEGREGVAVGLLASPETWTQFVNEKLTVRQAEVISRAAPHDEAVQRAGIQAVHDGEPLDSVRNIMLSTQLGMAEISGHQGDIFGSNNSGIEYYRKQAAIATRVQRGLSEQVKAVKNAANRPDLAKKGGVPVIDAKATLERVNQLENIRERWSKYTTDPALMDQLRAEMAGGPPAGEMIDGTPVTARDVQSHQDNAALADLHSSKLNEPPSIGERIQGALTFLNSQKGSVRMDIGPTIAKGVLEKLDPRNLMKPGEGLEARPKSAEYFDPYGINGGKIRGMYRKAFVFPQTLADKFPSFKPVFGAALKQEITRTKNLVELGSQVRDYFDLSNKDNLNSRLEIARIAAKNAKDKALAAGQPAPQNFAPSDQALAKAGLNPEEIKGFRSVRSTMDTALDLIAKQQLAEKVQELPPDKYKKYEAELTIAMNQLKGEAYVPFGRFGDHYVAGTRPDGKTYFSLQEGKQQAIAEKIRLQKGGYTDVKAGYMEHPAKNEYSGLPANVLGAMQKAAEKAGVDLPELPKSGFMKHFMHADFVEGHSTDFHRSIADYIGSMSNYLAGRNARREMDFAINQISPVKEGMLRDYSAKYRDFVLGEKPGGALKGALFHYYLGFNPKSALVNGTQSMMTTYPELARYETKPFDAYMSAMRKTRAYLKDSNAHQKSDPMLHNALDRAFKEGEIADKFSQEIRQSTGQQSGAYQKFSDLSTFMFSKAETMNRTHAFIAGWQAALKNPALKGFEAKYQFADDFVRRTQFQYGAANRPTIGQSSLGGTAMLFKTFQGSYMRLLRDSLVGDKKSFGVASRMLLTMGAMSGGVGYPLVKEAIKAGEALGYDPKKKMRETFGDGLVSDVLMYGLPMLAGMNLSGAAGVSEVVPDLGSSPTAALGSVVGGVAVNPLERGIRASQVYDQTGNASKAAQEMLPEALRNAAVGARAMADGNFRDAAGNIISKASKYDAALKMAGVQPSSLTKAQMTTHSIQLVKEEATKPIFRGFADQLVEAKRTQDADAIKAIRLRIQKWNMENPTRIFDAAQYKTEIQNAQIGHTVGLGARKVMETPKKSGRGHAYETWKALQQRGQ